MLNKFLEYLEEQVRNRSIYIWGGQGQGYPTVTEAWIKKKETGTNRTRALATYRAAVKAGYEKLLKVFDCSGLGAYWLYNEKHLIDGDKNANGLMGMCTLIQKTHVKRGDWVFKRYATGTKRAYHIGYVVDDALNVVEARGRAYGVVKRPLAEGGWNAYGRPQLFAAEIDTPEEVAEHMAFNRQLKKGMKGDDVRELQKLLNVAGDSLTEDGDFGKKTEAAVRVYQKRMGLTVDGIAGKNTITALGGEWGLYPKGEIVICTFNIKRGTHHKGTLAKMAGIVRGADIAGLQEVTPSGLTAIGKAAGKAAHMCKTLTNYGHGILTGFTVDKQEIVTLEGKGERRKLHHLRLGDVSVYNTHIHYTDPPNADQIRQLADIVSRDKSRVRIITGDFNTQDNYRPLLDLGFKQLNTGQAIRSTDGGASIVNKIDQIFVSGATVADLWKYEAVKRDESDHDALFARIKIN